MIWLRIWILNRKLCATVPGWSLCYFYSRINSLCPCDDIIIPPLQQSWKGGILVSRRPSVCLSIRLWTESCLLCNFTNTCWIHFIFAHLFKQLKKVCRMQSLYQNSKIWKKNCNFDFVFFWLGIKYDSTVWVIMRRWGVSSECRLRPWSCGEGQGGCGIHWGMGLLDSNH